MNTSDSIFDRDRQVLRNYEHSSASVLARWGTYDLALDRVDFEQIAYEASGTNPGDTIVDVGSSDGIFLDRSKQLFGHEGTRIGIDINPGQFARQNYPRIPNALLDQKLREALPNSLNPLHSGTSPLMRSTVELQFLPMAGDITQLPLKSGSVDKLFGLFMLYHVTEPMQSTALQEVKRVLKLDGVFTLTTSGDQNKSVHREIEAHLAKELGVEPPKLMNSGFTTERATKILPEYFRYVYRGLQDTYMVMRNEADVGRYIASHLSLYDQYNPSPDFTKFELELDILRTRILIIISHNSCFKDVIKRSIFIASDTPINPTHNALDLELIAPE